MHLIVEQNSCSTILHEPSYTQAHEG